MDTQNDAQIRIVKKDVKAVRSDVEKLDQKLQRSMAEMKSDIKKDIHEIKAMLKHSLAQRQVARRSSERPTHQSVALPRSPRNQEGSPRAAPSGGDI